jgi:hypothetical protein
MNLSDIQGNSLIISIAFTLLIGAIIVYYLNTRIVSVEKSLTRQNTILGEFIANIRNEIAGPMVSVASGPASKDATQQAKLSAETFLNNPQEKINVSDDSEESDSESESDSETESESDNDEEENAPALAPVSDDEGVVKIIDLNSQPKEADPFITDITDLSREKETHTVLGEDIKTISLHHNTEDLESLQVESKSDISSESESESENEAIENEPKQPIEEPIQEPITNNNKDVSLEDVEVLPEATSTGLDVHQLFAKHLEPAISTNDVTNIANVDEESSSMNYQKLKVDELRKLAKEASLGNDDEIGKMKKKDLVVLLSNNA